MEETAITGFGYVPNSEHQTIEHLCGLTGAEIYDETGLKREEGIGSVTIKFPNGDYAEIICKNDEEEEYPYSIGVLYDANGEWLADGEQETELDDNNNMLGCWSFVIDDEENEDRQIAYYAYVDREGVFQEKGEFLGGVAFADDLDSNCEPDNTISVNFILDLDDIQFGRLLCQAKLNEEGALEKILNYENDVLNNEADTLDKTAYVEFSCDTDGNISFNKLELVVHDADDTINYYGNVDISAEEGQALLDLAREYYKNEFKREHSFETLDSFMKSLTSENARDKATNERGKESNDFLGR